MMLFRRTLNPYCKKCKPNYALCVKLILSASFWRDSMHQLVLLISSCYENNIKIVFDIAFLYDIITFTLLWRSNHGKNKNRDSQREFNIKPSSRKNLRLIIPRLRLFRLQGFDTNQIRNATESFVRWMENITSNQNIWFLQAVFLQSSCCLPKRRSCWVTTTQKRSARPSQIHERYACFSGYVAQKKSRLKANCGYKQATRQIRHFCALSKCETNFKFYEKKTPETQLNISASTLKQYEMLRSLVIEGSNKLSSDYWIFTNQGMFAWMKRTQRILDKQNSTTKCNKAELIDNPIIHIFANMVINLQQETNYAC
jgi:hypothetical protein